MNIYTLIKENNRENSSKTALTIALDNGSQRSYSFKELFSQVEILAKALVAAGMRAGDRIAIVSENNPEWNMAFLAILKLEGTAVLVDASLSGAEINQLINHSDVRAVFTSTKLMEKLTTTLVTDVPVLDGLNNGQVFAGYPSSLPANYEQTFDGDSTIAAIIFSSGTTRRAEGIMHSHEALVKSTMMCATSNKLDQNGRYLSVIPNSHIYGLICLVLAPMLLGADIRYIESMNGEAIKKAFDEYHPTVFPCVPKVFELFKTQAMQTIESKKITQVMFRLFFPLCLALRKKTGLNLGKVLFKSIHQAFGGSIDILCAAGAPMAEETANFYLGTGFNLLITYGATETNIPTIGNWGTNLTADTCGKPYSDVDVKLGETGEILIKSPYMMKGYFRNPEATLEVFEDGWLKTGDLGALDAKGNYKIIGRSKENIVLATGKKIAPDDIEVQYSEISGVSELVISGVPVASGSYDEVHGFIVKDQTNQADEVILKEIHERSLNLAPTMKITKLHFVTEIPKTSLQKPKRYLLKKQVLEASQTTVEPETPILTAINSVEDQLISLVINVGSLDASLVSLDSKPFSELGMDSLSAMTLAFQIEEQYQVKVDDYFHQEITIGEIAAHIKMPMEASNQRKSSNNYPKVKKNIDYVLFKAACILARMLYKVSVKNERTIPTDSGYIICANHVSNLDYLWLTVNFKKTQFINFCCMAKTELVNSAGISQLLARICGMIPVNREKAGMDALAYCKDKLQEKAGLLIHPEGTRSRDGQLGEMKQGAAVLAIESGVPIIPAYIRGAYEIFPPGQKLPSLFNFAKMRKYPVEVIYGKPIFPQNFTAEELINQVEQSILSLKGVSQ